MKRTDIINATKPLTIEVPEQLARSSKRRKNPYHCVVAEACSRLPEVDEAIIHLSTAYLRFKGEEHFRRYRVQTRLRDQIVVFDKYGDFEPGEYTLAVIQPSHRANGKRQGGETKSKSRRDGSRNKRAFIKGVRAPAHISTL